MNVSKADFDSAAKNLLGTDAFNALVGGGANRSDLCREVAWQVFVDDLAPENQVTVANDLSVVKIAAGSLYRAGALLLTE